ncbi:hypothetical protein HDU98_002167 [Podochytrium sp. JEL0797]|nr:hypothetical protein HDU98_002167 [Podochytrium sp. JEL0797]
MTSEPPPLRQDALIPDLSKQQEQQMIGVVVPSPLPPKYNIRTTDYVLKSLFAGGLAGCAAKTVIAPMDRVKILFQTDNPRYMKYSGSLFGVFRAIKDIHSVFGIRGLFQGHSATLLRIFPYAAVKFMTYEQYKNWIMPTKQDETPFRRTLAGSMAGVSSLFVSYPLDLLRVRLAYDIKPKVPNRPGVMPPAPGLLETARVVYHESNPWSHRFPYSAGFMNFFRGFLPTTYGIIPYAGASFLCYETFKGWAMERPGWWVYDIKEKQRHGAFVDSDGKVRQLTWWAQLSVGATSGLLAQTASYPFEVIRRHMQVAGKLDSMKDAKGVRKFPTTAEMARSIYQKRGFKGFFVGLSIGYLKVIPMHAVSFYVYEYMKIVCGI